MINPAAIQPVDLPDIDEMPMFRRIALAEFTASVVAACFARPGAEEDFQRWKVEQEKLRADDESGSR